MNYQICLLLLCVCSVESAPSKQTLLYRTVDSLQSSLLYMRRNYRLLNLDGLTGIRIVQGQLQLLQQQKPAGAEISWLQQMVELCDEIVSLATPSVRSYEPAYFQDLSGLIDSDLWKFDVLVDRQLESNTGSEHDKTQNYNLNDEKMTESQSDACIKEILQRGDSCDVSERCVELMLSDDAHGYTATHQVYYLLILSQSKCLPKSSNKVVGYLEKKKCQAILRESSSMNLRLTTGIKQDLFMEQAGICGLVGFWRDFSRPEWIEHVISWQRSQGCYGNAELFLDELSQIDEETRFRRRVKREERIMDGNCLCHRSTVAALALSQYLKALLL